MTKTKKATLSDRRLADIQLLLERVCRDTRELRGQQEKLPLMFEAVQFLSRDTKAACEMLHNLGGASNDPTLLVLSRDVKALCEMVRKLPESSAVSLATRVQPATPAPPAQPGVAPQPARITLTSNECTQLYSRVYQLERSLEGAVRRQCDLAVKDLRTDVEGRIEHFIKEESKDWSRVESKVDGLKSFRANDYEAIQSLFARVAKLEAERDQLRQPKRRITKR